MGELSKSKAILARRKWYEVNKNVVLVVGQVATIAGAVLVGVVGLYLMIALIWVMG